MAGRYGIEIFGRAWLLLRVNPAIVFPGLAIGAVSAVLQALFAGSSDLSRISSELPPALLTVTQIVAAILTISYTTGMADAAWRARRARLSDGSRAFARGGAAIFAAIALLFVLGIAAALLAPYTFSLSLVLYTFYSIYTIPAVVVGEKNGYTGLVQSVRIAYERPLTTLVMVVGILLVATIMSALAYGVAPVPFLGPLVSDLVVQSIVAYAVLVVVGEYRAISLPGARI